MKLRHKTTGEIADFKHNALLKTDGDGNIVVWTRRANDYKVYDSLESLNCFWEDYHPKEPLIKDEKIRMAVKAWAQQYDHDPIRVYINSDYITLYKDDINGYSSSAGIDLSPDVFEGMPANDKYYTIAELCGTNNDLHP